MNTKSSLLAALTVAMAGAAVGQTNNYSYGVGVGSGIPDGNFSGLTSTTNISGTIGTIANVTVSLDLSGGYNGDLYAYLVHGDGFVVLMNRPGRTGSDAFGYGDTGMLLTLSDAAASNLHFYQTTGYPGSLNGNGQLTGIWQPDGRNVDPANVTGGETPGTLFASFNDESADGTWTLFFADLSTGQTTTVNNWTLNIETVPEPRALSLLVGCGGLMVFWRCRRNISA